MLAQLRLVVNHAEAHVVVLADVFKLNALLLQRRADGVQVFVRGGDAEHGVLGVALRLAVLRPPAWYPAGYGADT